MGKWKAYALVAALGLTVTALACDRGEKEDKEEAAEEAAPAAAQAPAAAPGAPVAITEEKPGLMAKAKVQPEQARQAALAKVPNGTITKGELEEEDGKLIYSFDITVPGEAGVTELHVDAMTGEVIKTEHEDPSKEAAEAKKEKGK